MLEKNGYFTILIILLITGLFAIGSVAGEAPQEKEKAKQEKADDEKNGEKKDEKKEKPKFKEYDEVITEKAITKEGVFTTHQVEDKLYYEIQKGQLGKEFVWVTQVAKTQTGFGYGGTGVGDRTVRWERHKDNILLRNVEYRLRAKEKTHEAIAVDASSVAAIIQSFKIVTFGEDKTPVIDVTELFAGDNQAFSPKEMLNASSLDKSRSYISSVKNFPLNIETRVVATYKLKPPKPNAGRGFPRASSGDTSLGSVTVELHHSMVALPEKPMRPRLFDGRVGFFDGRHEDYSSEETSVKMVRYIRRWRLEKKDPSAEVSEPVKPIVWYVGRGVPERWRKYVKEGIEMWQPVFEKAGFANAILAKDAPTLEEDPDWDAEDARYASVRWLPSTIQNAYGPHVQDPRTGEILEADVRMFHNVLKLAHDWYFVQASPNDPRAQKLPLPDELVGELLRYIVAHEVGHSLGMRHNKKATSSYSIAQLRDPEFTRKNGTEASIMDYGRFNYVAQPGDGAALIPTIGPYDYFAVEWAYKEFADTKSPQEDKEHLETLLARQLENPMLRFGAGNEGGKVGRGDPSAQSEDLGDDAIEATRLGLLNLERVSNYLVDATCQEGEDYSQLSNLYNAMIGQMTRELGHVANIVGGIEIEHKVYGQDRQIYTPVNSERQRKATQFILDNGFKVPAFLIKKDIFERLGQHGITERIKAYQSRLLGTLFSSERISRMADLEATRSSDYSLSSFVGEITNGLFSELETKELKINLFRRNLQRLYVENLIKYTCGKGATRNDLQAIARGNLHRITRKISKIATKVKDEMTAFHLEDLRTMARHALEGKAIVN